MPRENSLIKRMRNVSSSRRNWLPCVWQQLGQALRRCHTSKWYQGIGRDGWEVAVTCQAGH